MCKFVQLAGGVALWLGVVGVAVAQVLPPTPPVLPDLKWPIEPSTGMYFDATQSGTGLGVDLFPVNGQPFFFGAFYHYSPDGAPTWFTFQSFLQQSSVATYLETGVAASVSGPWIVSQGGQCFDCAYTAPTTSATPFQRTVHVLGARQLHMPASGNAAALTLTRTDAVIASGHLLGQATLTSGTVYAVTARWRSSSTGQEALLDDGWVRFGLRPSNEIHNLFSGFVAEPGATPNSIEPPAWMVLHGDPNTLPQYEAKCLLEDGACNAGTGLADRDVLNDPRFNRYTFFVDPVTDRIRVYRRCVVNVTTCPFFGATHINGIGDVIEASPPRPGAPPRLITRFLNLEGGGLGGFDIFEVEFSPVSPEDLAAVFPHGVPAP